MVDIIPNVKMETKQVKEGDVIVLYYDMDTIFPDELNESMKRLDKEFPENNIIALPKGNVLTVFSTDQCIQMLSAVQDMLKNLIAERSKR